MLLYWKRTALPLLLGFVLFAPAPLSAQDPVFEAMVESEELVEGNRFEVNFTLMNARGRGFKPPAFSNFRVLGGPNIMEGVQIVNGKTSTHQTWNYILEPRTAGNFTIGSAQVTANGRTFRTDPVKIRVVAARSNPNASQPPSDRDDQLFIRGEISQPRAVIGQQVIYRIMLYTRMTVSNAELLAVPQAEKAFTHELRRFDTRTQYVNINKQQYAVRTLYEMSVFPQQTGILQIGSAQMRIGIEQSGAFGALFGPRMVLLSTDPVELTVDPLPVPAPDLFTGGVGQYSWEISVDNNTLTTDDATTLSIAVRGNGDARRFAAPRVEAPEGLEIIEGKIREEEEYENGQELVHSCIYDYVILPREAGHYTLRPECWYFNPDSNRYVAMTVPLPIELSVQPGRNKASQPLEPTDTGSGIQPPPLWWERPLAWLQHPITWILLASPFALLLAWQFLRRKKVRPAPAPKPPRPPDPLALSRQWSELRALARSGDEQAFYNTLYHRLGSYLGARAGLTLAEWSASTLRERLRMQQVQEDRIEAIHAVLLRCEQVLYAGRQLPDLMESTLDEAEAALQAIEKG